MRERLSVLVPVYNSEKYLKRCIDSIIRQTYKNLEIILVDDGSTDSSADICDFYADKDERISVVHKSNGGSSSARIVGLQRATQKYVTFVDSDDYIEANMYEELMKYLTQSDADIVVGGYVSEYQDGSTVCSFVSGERCVYSSENAIYAMFENVKFNWSMCDKIYKRSLFDKFDMANEWPVSYGEDTYINHKIFSWADKVMYIPLYAYHYCMNDDSMMHKGVNKDWLIYPDIYCQIIKESAEKQKNYTGLVAKLLLNMAHNCFVWLHENWNTYASEINAYREMVSSCLSIAKYEPSESERLKLNAIMLSYDDYENLIKKRDNKLMALRNLKAKIIVYGTGIVAKNIARAMTKLNIPINGFCVTHKNDDDKFLDKTVYQIDELPSYFKYATFVLAMRKESEREVADMLRGKGYEHIACLGTYSPIYVEPEAIWR